MLAYYALYFLPSNDRHHSGLGVVNGLLQLALAVGVPLAACLGGAASHRFRTGAATGWPAALALVVALTCAAGWALVVSNH